MNSPFKFLDAYTLADRANFFGRDEEIASLYGMVAKNRLILVYGQSGTGKTSLVQCGLAGRFDATDWYPLFIRRNDDLNRSLERQLQQVLGTETFASIPEALDDVYANFLRPVYLIFDQLEEVFILGSPDEQERFIQSIRAVMEASVPCRILFVIREEYLAHLYGFERVVPTLFDRRLRVEPMRSGKVREVLSSAFQRFNIGVEAPDDATYNLMIEAVSGGKAGIQLPYLQVYLDSLYREDFARTYAAAPPPAASDKWPALTFTRAEISQLGPIENVLEKFLTEQQGALQKALQERDPGIPPDAIGVVLDGFVSAEGTKRPLAYQIQGDSLTVEPAQAGLFHPLTPVQLGTCCRLLEQARLLRFGDDYVELAHDSLAALIDRRRSGQQRRLAEALTRLKNNYRDFRATGEYLSRRQLNALDDALPLLQDRIDADLRQYLAESEQRAAQTERAELEAERRKRRQARRIAIASTAAALLMLAVLLIALYQYRQKVRQAIAAQRNEATALKVEGRYDEALTKIAAVDQLAAALRPAERAELAQLASAWSQTRQLKRSADSLAALGDLRTALQRYNDAYALSPDAPLDRVRQQTAKDLETTFAELLRNGSLQVSAGQYRIAAETLQKALRLKPADVLAKELLGKCK